jgi:photosystem II stability/assembly factor-like uncharacterized protein
MSKFNISIQTKHPPEFTTLSSADFKGGLNPNIPPLKRNLASKFPPLKGGKRGCHLFLTIFIILLTSVAIYPQTTWQKQSCPIQDGLHNIFFVNDSLGWAITYGTGILIHTTDGGMNWNVQYQFDSLYFEQIQFVDKNNGWICGEYGFVVKSTDGGTNWIDVSPPIEQRISTPIDWSSKTKPEGWYIGYYSMHFFNKDTGFVAGQKLNLVENKREYIFYNTQDGGKSWQSNPIAPNEMTFDPYFIDKQTGFIGGTTNIYKTKDAGIHWNTITREKITLKDQLRSVFFFNESKGWACSFSGKVFIINRVDSKWDSVKVSNNRLRSVCFRNEKNGIVVGDQNKEAGSMFESNDGGKTWNKVAVDFADLHRIFLTNTKIWIVGKEGTILVRDREW